MRIEFTHIKLLLPFLAFLTLLSACGSNKKTDVAAPRVDTRATSASVGEDARAWTSVGKGIVDEIGVAWVSGEIYYCDSETVFCDKNLDKDLYGKDALAVLDILCPLANNALAATPASASEFVRGCDVTRALITSTDESLAGATASRAAFRRVDDAFVSAGASDQAISDSARRSVLLPVLSKIFEPYRDGTPDDLGASQTRHSLRYVCSSMLSAGDASTEACKTVVAAISPGTATQPATVRTMIASILAALAQP
jgi:hypothetical protein